MNNQEQKGIFDLGFVNRINHLSTELPITNREKEILTEIAQGKTNRQISQKLILSPSTVRNHISSIFNKLRISNRSQATAIAIYSGLLTLENFSDQALSQASDSK
jgi:DNA-binding NarL/FixJ family response regulator